ncbi:MAG TPA: MarR family transcriptional regulator [Clostridia bacterium]|nr:MarR family transcriptional regulator [Clostridia bacterium]
MEYPSKIEEVTRLFRDVGHLIKQNMNRGFEDVGLTPPQFMVITALTKTGRMKVSELSRAVGLSNSTVSDILDRLEKQGVISRERSEEDKRVVYVKVTPKFECMHQGIHQRTREYFEDILDRGTPEEVNTVIEGLKTFKKLLQKRIE